MLRDRIARDPSPARSLAALAVMAGLVSLAMCLPCSPAWSQTAPSPRPSVPWQRDLDDALALSKDTGKPLLVCVNADGEPASESLAARRYHDPAFIELMEGFVPVIASAFRHNSTDRGTDGRRLPCPRFGRVTCAEHIAIEPVVFERWFQGTRVAPRHVGIDKKGKALFDLYLLANLGIIDTTLRNEGRKGRRLPDAEGLSERALLDSRDAAAREVLEALFVTTDEKRRLDLADKALSKSRTTQHPEVLRLALTDPAPKVRRAAAEKAASLSALVPTDLAIAAATVLHADDVLLDRIARELGSRQEPDAQRMALMLNASREPSRALDIEAWGRKLSVEDAEAPLQDDEALLNGQSVRLEKDLAGRPKDLSLRTELARTYLALSRARSLGGEQDVSYLWELAREEASAVLKFKKAPPAAHALFARTDWLLGGQAVDAAAAAARALPGLLSEARSRLAAETLDVWVQAQADRAFEQLDAGALPEEASIADVATGARLILQHPLATAWQRAAALDAVGGLQLDGLHGELAWLGVGRHPLAPELHEHLRWHLLRDGDPGQVGAAYDTLLSSMSPELRPAVRWFAAFAALQAGDQLRIALRTAEAIKSYRLSIAGFKAAKNMDESFTNTAAYRALAHAGLARVLLDEEFVKEAAQELLAGLADDQAALDLPDAYGGTPRQTTADVITALRRGASSETKAADPEAEQLAALLDGLLGF